jgi:hypothetical protein
MKKIMLLLIGILLFLPSCAHAVRYDGPYSGKVIDAETKEPIEGVVVLGVWYTAQFSPAGATHNFYDAMETVTDKNGEFSIPGMGLRVLSNLKLRQIVIFKAGYEHLASGPWISLKKDILLRKKIKWEGDKAIIRFNKFTLEYRKKRLFGKENIPDEKQRLLIRELNKERVQIGLTPYREVM